MEGGNGGVKWGIHECLCICMCECVCVCMCGVENAYPDEGNVRINSQWVDCVAVCCSVLQCVAVCCSVLQCVAVCCSVL